MQTDHKSPEQWELGDELLSLPIVLRLHKASLQVSGITDNAWEELHSVVHSSIPSFFDSLNAMNNKINLREIGETTKGVGRYKNDSYEFNNFKMIPVFYGTKTEILVEEKRRIYHYHLQNGCLPPGNKIFR